MITVTMINPPANIAGEIDISSKNMLVGLIVTVREVAKNPKAKRFPVITPRRIPRTTRKTDSLKANLIIFLRVAPNA